MPPQIQALLQNRNALIGIGVAVLLVIGGIIFLVSGNKPEAVGGGPLEPTQRTLASVEQLGKAIEIQALLAREGIRLDREEGDGGKVVLKFPEEATKEDRDRALITLVQSGLMDKNVGLEAFDKGDLTASREEKRIKLIRAQQGELARLIRKIPPIQEASVSLSIPESSIFKSDQKPLTASVQVVIPNSERLTRDKVRSIVNLVVGSVQGLDAQHVALADTNGNTYNSVLDLGSELNDRLEEQDAYMKQKVSAQLDRLVGTGHYVVTVSTQLRETAKEEMTQTFDPAQSAVTTRQNFLEKLNTGAAGPQTGGPTSTLLPPGVTEQQSTQTSPGRGYTRTGTELAYANGKTQTLETMMPGIIEDISIAVSIDRPYFPGGMTVSQMQELLARAANPKVNAESVSIVTTEFSRPDALSTGTGALSPGEGESKGTSPWVLIGAGLAILLSFVMAGMTLFGNRGGGGADPQQLEATRQELAQLREFAIQQQAQLQQTLMQNQQTQQLLENQQRQLASVTSGSPGAQAASSVPASSVSATVLPSAADQLRETLMALKADVEAEPVDALAPQVRTWIEDAPQQG